jgi:hypothetical protein
MAAIYRRRFVASPRYPRLLLPHHRYLTVDSPTRDTDMLMRVRLLRPFPVSTSPLGWPKSFFGIHIILECSSYYRLPFMLLL